MKKILLIEDNNDMRENTAEILELANYKVLTAANGKEGVEVAQKEIPDLIICDIMMPVLDGYGALHLLSKKSDTAAIPFIFLTAKAERSDLRKGMEMGADDYVTKPFDDIELLNAIESRLKKSALVKQEFSKDASGLNDFILGTKRIEDIKSDTIRDREIKAYKNKEAIYNEGSYPRGIFFLNKGKVKTYRTHDMGKEFITGLYKGGDFFGYLTLLEDTKYEDSAEALDDCEIYIIPKEEFFDLVYQNAQVSKKFIEMLSNSIKEKEEQLVKLAYNSVRRRVAEGLVTLYNRYKKEGESKFSISIAREDLANIAGTATETTIRTLSDFKEESLISVKGSTIFILDYDKLAGMRN